MSFLFYLSKIIKLSRLPAIKNSVIESTSKICSATYLVDSTIGRYSYVGHDCTIINTDVGSFCSIADNVIVGGASHAVDWVTTSPVFNKGKNVLRKNFAQHEYTTSLKTTIGSDVWIGNNVLIKSGVHVGHGSVVGMGAVVTKDIPPYEIWAGNPAKFIRKRFDQEKIDVLLSKHWWDASENDLVRLANHIDDPDKFISVLSEIF